MRAPPLTLPVPRWPWPSPRVPAWPGDRRRQRERMFRKELERRRRQLSELCCAGRTCPSAARALLAGRTPSPRRRPRWKHTPDLKYVLIVLRADDNGEGGTFVLYSLICHRVRAGLLPGGDELTGRRDGATPASVSSVRGALERHRVLQRLLRLALLGTCMVIGDGVLTPAALLSLVSRMILGGMSVIGIYIWASEASFKATPLLF